MAFYHSGRKVTDKRYLLVHSMLGKYEHVVHKITPDFRLRYFWMDIKLIGCSEFQFVVYILYYMEYGIRL